MNIEQQVCSLEYAKRLKELRIKQDSIFYWADGSIVISIDLDLLLENNKTRSQSFVNNSWPDQDNGEVYSAFTVAELCEFLPEDIEIKEHCWASLYESRDAGYQIEYDYVSHGEHTDSFFTQHDKNEANCRAKMIIYLLENGLIKND